MNYEWRVSRNILADLGKVLTFTAQTWVFLGFFTLKNFQSLYLGKSKS